MPQTRIYFCYRFYASLVNSLTQSTPYVSCHSYFSGDLNVNTHSVFADDFWSVVTQFSLTIPFVNDDSVSFIDFIRQPWISIRCRFHSSLLTQFSKMISHPTVIQFSKMIPHSTVSHRVFDDSMPQTWIYFSYRFYASLVNSLTQSTPSVSCHSYFSGNIKVYVDSVFADDFWSVVTQFSLTIPCVNDDTVFSNDFIRQPWISIRCRFHPSPLTQFSTMISHPTVTQFSKMISRSTVSHSVFDNSMPQTRIYFCYPFNASLVYPLTLSTPYVRFHSYFSGDFMVNSHSVFADDFWSVVMQFSLTIPCVNDDSVFSIDFIRQPWISIRCQFQPSTLTQFPKMISRSTVTQFSLTIYGSPLA